MTRRLYYIDWLRVLAVLLLFPFHTSRVFNFGEAFYVKSPYLSMALNYVLGFTSMWHMPLLFLLAGSSSFFSLSHRSPGQYAGERAKRLLVPLVFGILVLIPPQTYVGARFNSGYTASYWTYITSGAFLKWNIHDGGDYYGGFGVGQLWFILFLFVMSLIALPFFAWATTRGAQWTRDAARALSKPAWWLVPPVVLWFAEGLPEIAGKNLLYYLAYFVLGFIVIADERFAAEAERRGWLLFAVGAIACIGYTSAGPWRDSLPDPSAPLLAVNYAGMLGRWLLLVGMLGLGRCYLDRPSKTLSYLAEGSYPVYILHQTAIVLVAFWVVTLPIGGVTQWVIVLVAAVVTTFATYELVRRFAVLRLLFGMRPKQP